MTGLLVDDNKLVINALKMKIDWNRLGITRLFTAANITQAKTIFLDNQIDLLICDIEMPNGSGLELLAWILEQGYVTQTIFLTSYADFNYAQKAIELHSFDYFLKPIEFDKLTVIIEKALRKVRQEQENKQVIAAGISGQANHKYAVEHFWRKVIRGKAFPTSTAISQSIKEVHLSYEFSDLFVPILVQVIPLDLAATKEEKAIFDYGVENILNELFCATEFSAEAVCEHVLDSQWIVILKPTVSEFPRDAVERCCLALIEETNRYLGYDVCCYVGTPCSITVVSKTVTKLTEVQDEFVNRHHEILWLDHYHERNVEYISPNSPYLERTLMSGDIEAFSTEIRKYLHQAERSNALNSSVLHLFQMDLIQLIYSVAKQKGIPAHELFPKKEADALYERSLNSISDMENYLINCASMTIRNQAAEKTTKISTEQIKQYIHEHLAEDLSRNRLAEHFFLNPDYLARLFARQEDTSLGNYIMQSRIDEAGVILKNTDLSINEVASKVGYANYSHFSRVFKELCGSSPLEYRRDFMQNNKAQNRKGMIVQ